MFGGFAISESIAVHLSEVPPAVHGSDVAIAAPSEVRCPMKTWPVTSEPLPVSIEFYDYLDQWKLQTTDRIGLKKRKPRPAHEGCSA